MEIWVIMGNMGIWVLVPLYLYTLITPITEGHPYGYNIQNLSSKPEN